MGCKNINISVKFDLVVQDEFKSYLIYKGYYNPSALLQKYTCTQMFIFKLTFF